MNPPSLPLSRKKWILVFIKSFTALALAGYLWLLLIGGTPVPPVQSANANANNICNFLTFTMNSHYPFFPPEVIQGYNSDFGMWQGRWAALKLASTYWDATWPLMLAHKQIHFDGYGAYTFLSVWAAWFILWFLAYCALVARLDGWPLLMFGGFVGIASNLAFTTSVGFLPWDVCSMAFWAWGLVAFERGHLKTLFLVAAIGSCFKETVLLWLIPPLLSKLDKKWLYAGAVIIFFLICRALSCHLVIGNLHETAGALWLKNLHYLFTSTANNALFLDAGLVVTLWFTPLDRRLKYMVAVFLAGMFFMGGFNEYRQYFDILPIGLYGLNKLSARDGNAVQPAAPQGVAATPDSRV